MAQVVRRVFQLRPGEAGIVFLLGILLLGNSLAFEISGVVAVSGFLGDSTAENILIVWLIDMLLIAAAAGVHSLIVDRFNRIVLIRWMTFSFALLYISLRLLFTLNIPDWFNYGLLYLIAEQQWFFFPLIFWILANDILEVAQTRRLFPVIASFGFFGKLIGIIIAGVSPAVLDSLEAPREELISFNVFIYLLVFLAISIGLNDTHVRETVPHDEPLKETLTEGWDFVRNVPMYRYLILVVVAMIAGETFIEFRFLDLSEQQFPDSESGDYQTFYSFYRFIFVIVSIVVQGLFSGRIIKTWGLKNSSFALPFFTVIGLGWMLAVPNMISSLGGILLNKIPLYTIDESSRKAFQALIPEERRGRVSIFMDSYIYALGAILGIAIIGITIIFEPNLSDIEPYAIYLGIGLVMAILALVAAFQVRRTYDVSLMNWRLKRRQRTTTFFDKLNFD